MDITKEKRHDFVRLGRIIQNLNRTFELTHPGIKATFESLVVLTGDQDSEGYKERRHDVIIWMGDSNDRRLFEAVRETRYNSYENIDEVERDMERDMIAGLAESMIYQIYVNPPKPLIKK